MEQQNSIAIFIAAASISAQLAAAHQEAKRLSLTAKNARAIAIRAGEKALGFRVITDFIDEFARTTIACAEQISQLSRRFAQVAMQQSALSALNRRYQQAFTRMTEDGKAQIMPLYDSYCTQEVATQADISRLIRQLDSLLATIRTQIRASAYIAATSKIEAVYAEEYQENLDSVALNIATTSENILQCIDRSIQFLALSNQQGR